MTSTRPTAQELIETALAQLSALKADHTRLETEARQGWALAKDLTKAISDYTQFDSRQAFQWMKDALKAYETVVIDRLLDSDETVSQQVPQ